MQNAECRMAPSRARSSILHSAFCILHSVMNLLITNGRVVDPSQHLDAKLDVLIENGAIAKVERRIKADLPILDAAGLIVAPGFIDLHTHLREPAEEDAHLNEGGVMHEGYYSTLLGMAGIPAASEETLVARDVILAALTKSHVHIAHASTAGAIDAVRRARAAGVRATCEVTPHHIALGDDAVQ